MTSTQMNSEKIQTTKYVIGSRPVHAHVCGCQCNSPYCNDPQHVPCPEHKGPPIVVEGLEPWRGRS